MFLALLRKRRINTWLFIGADSWSVGLWVHCPWAKGEVKISKGWLCLSSDSLPLFKYHIDKSTSFWWRWDFFRKPIIHVNVIQALCKIHVSIYYSKFHDAKNLISVFCWVNDYKCGKKFHCYYGKLNNSKNISSKSAKKAFRRFFLFFYYIRIS